MEKKLIHVLVADDSVLMRLLICDILLEDSDIKQVSQVKNGLEAFEFCKKNRPDVVLMDMNMGHYDGAFGVQKIMEECPTPIIILSAVGNTDMEPIMEVMAKGAIDFIHKPVKGNADLRDMAQELIRSVKEASRLELGYVHHVAPKKINTNPHQFGEETGYQAVIIGSSTGGPTAVETIIHNLPSNLAVPVVIAQHMPPHFVTSFAARLNALSPLTIAVARKDDVLKPRHVYIAAGTRNIILKRDGSTVSVDYTFDRYKEFNSPSVDALMLSAAEVYGPKCIGVILTGMGRDGTDGLKAIRNAGGYTIAQSKETCVVYGMPKSAVEAGAVMQSVPIAEIGGFIVSCLA